MVSSTTFKDLNIARRSQESPFDRFPAPQRTSLLLVGSPCIVIDVRGDRSRQGSQSHAWRSLTALLTDQLLRN